MKKKKNEWNDILQQLIEAYQRLRATDRNMAHEEAIEELISVAAHMRLSDEDIEKAIEQVNTILESDHGATGFVL